MNQANFSHKMIDCLVLAEIVAAGPGAQAHYDAICARHGKKAIDRKRDELNRRGYTYGFCLTDKGRAALKAARAAMTV